MEILRDFMNSERAPSNFSSKIFYYVRSKDDNRQDGILNNSRQQNFETNREEFRTYLERSGVIDALTKVLVLLYEETDKPDDALEYVSKYLGSAPDNTSEVESLKQELDSAKSRIAELEAKLLKFELEDASA